MTGKMKSYQQLYVGMNYFANFVNYSMCYI